MTKNTDTPLPSNHMMLSPQGEFKLERMPPNPSLQAWDSADLYLLKYVDEQKLLSRQTRTLVVNDSFGALSTAVADCGPTMTSDSFLTKLALSKNLERNGVSSDQVCFNDKNDLPQEVFDLILFKIPKSLALLEHQLYSLRPLIGANTQFIAASMTRGIHNSTLALFETILGGTTTSLAWKKSRLIHVARNTSLNQGHSPYPSHFVVEAGREFILSNHANLFSRDRLDNGSRLLIENMPSSEDFLDIVDLGCGNGILGLVAASLNVDAEILFADESYAAIASAKENFKVAFEGQRKAEFQVTHCLQGVASNSVDLVLNNPPFHQQQSVSDSIAWQMFIDARKVLKSKGELWVVGNRHLGYYTKLKKIFGRCERIDGNRKYEVFKAIKT